MADWDARLQANGWRDLGGAVDLGSEPNRASPFLHRQKGPNGPAPRIHQENAEDAEQDLDLTRRNKNKHQKGLQ